METIRVSNAFPSRTRLCDGFIVQVAFQGSIAFPSALLPVLVLLLVLLLVLVLGAKRSASSWKGIHHSRHPWVTAKLLGDLKVFEDEGRGRGGGGGGRSFIVVVIRITLECIPQFVVTTVKSVHKFAEHGNNPGQQRLSIQDTACCRQSLGDDGIEASGTLDGRSPSIIKKLSP
jgi:hypothetical protein